MIARRGVFFENEKKPLDKSPQEYYEYIFIIKGGEKMPNFDGRGPRGGCCFCCCPGAFGGRGFGSKQDLEEYRKFLKEELKRTEELEEEE